MLDGEELINVPSPSLPEGIMRIKPTCTHLHTRCLKWLTSSQRNVSDSSDPFLSALQVTLVGRIIHAEEAATCLSFKLDDGSGTLDVRYWVDSDDSELMQQNKAQWRVDAHVRIHGHVRSFNGERQVVAYSIRTITDFNEVRRRLPALRHVVLLPAAHTPAQSADSDVPRCCPSRR